MGSELKLSKKSRVAWAIALVSLPLISAGTIFGLTEKPLYRWEDSGFAQYYTKSAINQRTIISDESVSPSPRFGRENGASTLVLYDASGDAPEVAEMYGIAAANLATHFGKVEVMKADDYTADTMSGFDAVIYLGLNRKAAVPPAFIEDVREGVVPVMWAGRGIEDLAQNASAGTANFTAQYGWDPVAPTAVDSERVSTVVYGDFVVQRFSEDPDPILSPNIVDPTDVDVIASAVCGDPSAPSACDDGDPEKSEKEPWAVRSGNLTYLAEVPLNDIDKNDLYLVFADLYYDLLAPDTAPLRQAAVRLEDVGPEADPADLRAIADYLQQAGIPFQVAVVPIHVARTPDEEGWYGLSLLDTPEVIDALKYMQERGGTLIQHGTTHQYGAVNNPYSGRSGEDFEFYRYGCSDTELPPFRFEECENDSYVNKAGPIADDSVEEHVQRMAQGRQIMIDAGLGKPRIFETPHYGASVNAYVAMSRLYDARYEQVDYYAGTVSGGEIRPEFSYGQRFPYTVHDIYGSTVYPENLGNVTVTEQNNHAVRDPAYLIDRAADNLLVRESTASFFFHPYLELDALKETVTGIQELGYKFVSVDELR